MEEDGQAAVRDGAVHGQGLRRVDVEGLEVGVELHAVQAQRHGAVELGLEVRIARVHRGKAEELRVQLALLVDEGIDVLDLVRARGRGADEVALYADGAAAAEELLGAAQVTHGDVVEAADVLPVALRAIFSGKMCACASTMEYEYMVPPGVGGSDKDSIAQKNPPLWRVYAYFA